MSLYHLHARLLEGTLLDVTRNELQSRETDDWDQILAFGGELAERGFAVWVYDHGHRSPYLTASDFRVVAEFSANGERVR
jgi:hypothetical protein